MQPGDTRCWLLVSTYDLVRLLLDEVSENVKTQAARLLEPDPTDTPASHREKLRGLDERVIAGLWRKRARRRAIKR